MDDFSGLSPSEFEACYEAWYDWQEDLQHDAWARMRLHGVLSIQPHVKRRLRPAELLPFPWEKARKAEVPPVGKVEAWQRLRALLGSERE